MQVFAFKIALNFLLLFQFLLKDACWRVKQKHVYLKPWGIKIQNVLLNLLFQIASKHKRIRIKDGQT